jgi:hypothetical protein
MTGTPYIALSVQIDRSTVRYELRVSRRSLKAYFSSEKMFVTYDVDLTGVPEAFLAIPGPHSPPSPGSWARNSIRRLRTRSFSNPSNGSDNRSNVSIRPSIGAAMFERPPS